MKDSLFFRIFRISTGRVILSIVLIIFGSIIGFVCSTIADPSGSICGGFLFSLFSVPLLLVARIPFLVVIPILVIYIISSLIIFAFKRQRKDEK